MTTNIGGQAVLEGVMMRGPDSVAVAVRKPDRNIHVETKSHQSMAARYPLLRAPLIRGTVVLIESTLLGLQALQTASQVALGQEPEESSKASSVIPLLFGLVIAVFLFVVCPVWLARWTTGHRTGWEFNAVEGVIRLILFVAYLGVISTLKDIHRLFQYHGAEHKTINTYEAGAQLTVENVRKHSLIHRRCGTSFLLFVVVISIFVYTLVTAKSLPIQVLCRVALLPVVAGIAYELIRISAESENRLFLWIISPGLWMQRLTTREPDDEQIEVAIASVLPVLGRWEGSSGVVR